MSHTTTVKTQLKNRELVEQAAKELGYEVLDVKSVKLFQNGGAEVQCAYAVKIPGWNYPVAVKEDGTVEYDNYNGSWGKQEMFDQLQAGYAEAVANDYANSHGYRVIDRLTLDDGSIQLRIDR